MNNKLRQRLIDISSPEKVKFQSRIINSNYQLLGHSVGDVRKIAKDFKDSFDLNSFENEEYYEDYLVEGLIIAYNKRPVLEKTQAIENYLNKVDSWALIDSFCSTFNIKKEEKEELFKLLSSYLEHPNEFFKRYALVMFLSHYLKYDNDEKKLRRPKEISIDDLNKSFDGKYIDKILDFINRDFPDYNASMATAWLGAEAFLFYPSKIIDLIENNNMDKLTFKRMLNKIIESRTPSKEVKEIIKKYRSKIS